MKKHPVKHRHAVDIVAVLAVGLVCMLAIGVHDFRSSLTIPAGEKSVYMDEALGFAMRVPKAWAAPEKLTHPTVTEIRFNSSLRVLSGKYFSAQLQRNLTTDDIAQHMFPNDTAQNIDFNGIPSKKILRANADGSKGYVIITHQPHEPADAVVLIYVMDDAQADQAASSFSFTRT